jgi:uncharacterized protein involved in response to NO
MVDINRWQAVQAYGFRPFFLVLPAYIAVSILLWALVLSGWLPLFFTEQALAWHIYEMLYGIASAAIAGFILTAIPEFYSQTKPFAGKPLLGLTALWLLGRVAFWSIDAVGVGVVALTNLPFLLWVILLIAGPVFSDPNRKHISLALVFIALWLVQVWFFCARANLVGVDELQVLKFALGLFVVLILLALRRISTGVTNTWLERRGVDEVFMARPPAYNIAIICVVLFSIVEFVNPANSVLGWLGLAAAAGLLNLLNDFFLQKARPLCEPYLAALALIPVLMATGYGLMGIDYLHDGMYGLNHFRHFLTTGAFGLAVFMVMSIVGTVHTGRTLVTSRWMVIGIALIVGATLARGLIPFFPQLTQALYKVSALLWALPFIIYLVGFFAALTSPRVDGLPG